MALQNATHDLSSDLYAEAVDVRCLLGAAAAACSVRELYRCSLHCDVPCHCGWKAMWIMLLDHLASPARYPIIASFYKWPHSPFELKCPVCLSLSMHSVANHLARLLVFLLILHVVRPLLRRIHGMRSPAEQEAALWSVPVRAHRTLHAHRISRIRPILRLRSLRRLL